MGLFDKDVENCVDCGKGVSGGRAFDSTACRCGDCRKTWGDRADAAILATKLKSEARRKTEAEQSGAY